jgi:hypothetical protein
MPDHPVPFVPQQLLAPLYPDESALIPLFRAHIDESMLREIAAADYGWKADECYELLQPVLQTGVITPDDFNVREVLELISLSEPDEPRWRPGGCGERGHWMRLFACTQLVRLGAKEPTRSERRTYLQMTSSAIELGRLVAEAAAQVLAWRFLANPGIDTEDPPFLALLILLVAVHMGHGQDGGSWLKELAGWVESEELRARNARSERRLSWGPWLAGSIRLRDRSAVWRSLAERILVRPDVPHPSNASEALRRLGESVVGAV